MEIIREFKQFKEEVLKDVLQNTENLHVCLTPTASVGEDLTKLDVPDVIQVKRLQKADIKLIADGHDYYERYEKLKELKQYF